MWLDDVVVPWNRVFLTEPSPEPVARWLFWHQLYCWLAKAEFTLGLALACTHAMGLAAHEPTIEYLLDLITDVQTVRSCQTAAELDPEFTADGYCSPNHSHLAAGALAMLKARRRMAEILRILPGSSLVVAPTDRDLADPALAGGPGGVVRRRRLQRAQRAALLQMAWDHVGSALDQREHVFELHANGGDSGLARPVAPTASTATTSWPTPSCRASACRCRRSTSTRSATRRWRRGDR